MTRSEIVYVAISPPVKLEENLIKKVAAIIDKDLYGIRLRLAGEIPSIISQYDTVHRAELSVTAGVIPTTMITLRTWG
jgi:hypothetical protein